MLRQKPDLPEVSFWAPSAASFHTLTRGELFLFNLRSPRNFIVGGGVFAYAEGGVHEARNGLPLRRDIHSLFDAEYVTVTQELRFAVSGRIREEFDNGVHYYALREKSIDMPDNPSKRPDPGALRWHNEKRFNG